MMNPEKSHCRGCSREAKAVAVPVRGGAALDNRGFTLIEMLVVCAILGVLVTLSIPSYTAMINTAKISRCAEEIRMLEKDISAFQADRGILPPDLIAVGQGSLLDPWGHQYKYYNIARGDQTQYEAFMTPFLNTAGTGYDLYSLGADNDTTHAIPEPDTQTPSSDDIVRAADGAYVGLASRF